MGLAAALLLPGYCQGKRVERVLDDHLRSGLERAKFRPGKYVDLQPDPELSGGKPLLRARGTVSFPADRDTSSGLPGPPPSARNEPAPAVPCSLWDVEADITCRFESYRQGQPWGRFLVSGELRAWGQTRPLLERTADDMDLRVSRDVSPARTVWPSYEVRAGVGLPGPVAWAGGSWYFSRRFGLAGNARVPIATADEASADVGLAFRW